MFGMQFLKNVFAQNKTFCYFAASFEEANRFIDEYTSSATSADELQIPRFDNSTPSNKENVPNVALTFQMEILRKTLQKV